MNQTATPMTDALLNSPRIVHADAQNLLCRLERDRADLIAALQVTAFGFATLLCLATSPRFQKMTVKDAIAELIENGAMPPINELAEGSEKLRAILALVRS